MCDALGAQLDASKLARPRRCPCGDNSPRERLARRTRHPPLVTGAAFLDLRRAIYTASDRLEKLKSVHVSDDITRPAPTRHWLVEDRLGPAGRSRPTCGLSGSLAWHAEMDGMTYKRDALEASASRSCDRVFQTSVGASG